MNTWRTPFLATELRDALAALDVLDPEARLTRNDVGNLVVINAANQQTGRIDLGPGYSGNDRLNVFDEPMEVEL